jgi:hypothetical protein
MNKSGICATARTIASQWLTSSVIFRIKTQVAYRFPIITRGLHPELIIAVFNM